MFSTKLWHPIELRKELFIIEYKQTMNVNLVEMSLEELISRFSFTY
jgi:hypothetical protein